MTLVIERVNGDWQVRRAPANYEPPAGVDKTTLTIRELFEKAAEEVEKQHKKGARP